MLPPMAAVILRCTGGEEMLASIPRTAKLRDVQRDLCKKFGQRFPATMAILVVGGEVYSNFQEIPFEHCSEEGDIVDVIFQPTNDPSFYDESDRRPQPTLEEEFLWEEAFADGSTALDLQTWVKARRADRAAREDRAAVFPIYVPPWCFAPAEAEPQSQGA